ncbi:MAG: hypothetical protein IPK60_04635 [Sandaracinaceae bacterium]|nr:hypothetical protein [Sandaracinaceae bacterium]
MRQLLVRFLALTALSTSILLNSSAVEAGPPPIEDSGVPDVDAALPDDPDAGLQDAGASEPADAGDLADAGTTDADAGAASDAGADRDAGFTLDASTPIADAGGFDANAAPDSGNSGLGGLAATPSGGACNCDAAGVNSPPSFLALLLFSVLFAVRHRRERR